ncbi:MAG TPA: M20/M25/M40 family metallo-hydrolase [Blastocatellia bacterium]|nr:M20/M25/M40 family metallo-hydrolase [Blastocatellia bacterium]HMX29463.1 M20/M25/M40 family metallo-hydrolase [Blastocatellia bacterium]HMZ19812.1 M20/M25/M40 family metallo-hydrolase [Blastocatellia bacterium]HNG28358.1 M20/M25/M40 family metallo-hydrolase [Blastocatellia bacterium]
MANLAPLYQNLDSYIRSSRDEFEDKLAALVETPSISSDPERLPDIRRCADLASQYLRDLGAKAEPVPTPGFPVVMGSIIKDQKYPTVTIYNHLDVQPADPSEWNKAPFTFHKVGDRYEGRGTTDDKGPALTAMLAVRYAVQNGLPLNFKFIWELEEEIGSPHFEYFVKRNKGHLITDSILVSDTIWISRKQPAVPYGLRGLQGFLFKLETHAKDVHSGLVGGAARNPIGELAQVISQCYDAKTGKVKIPGFYDDVVPPTKDELNSFVNSGFTNKGYMKAHELKSLRPNLKTEADVLKAFMAAPTFEVHGITGGYSGPGVKTIVPYRAEAKISTRLVPNQRPAKIAKLVKDFVKEINPDVKVEAIQSLEPFSGDFTGAYADAARVAMKFAFGKEPAFTREGGSIGAVVTMQKHLRAPITFLGLSLPEHGYHAKNENYDWGQTAGGIKMFIKYFEEIAKLK